MSIQHLKKQSGVVLIISLILLVILTTLGLSSMQGTMSEIAMSGNLRESDLSFQTAEMGLIAAEEFIESAGSLADFNNANGLYDLAASDPDYFQDATWASAQVSGVTVAGVHSKPKFVIKYLGDRVQNSGSRINIGGYGSSVGKKVSNFRSTARGYGQTDRASTMVQSYFGREF